MIWEDKKERKDSRAKWTVLLLLLILLVLCIIIGIIYLQRRNNAVPIQNPGTGVRLLIEPDEKGSRLPENENTAEQDVAISGIGTMTIPANKKDATVDFYNPKENEQMYYLVFELRIYDDSEQGYEVLYTSGLVEPGKHVNRITLSHGLEQGIYDAVVHIQPYRMDEEKTLTNNADIKTRLIVNEEKH